jgi:phage minor structural protein
MVCIFTEGCEEFENNGLGTLTPTSCAVREEAGGAYELTLVHPMDKHARYTNILKGYILRVPVPARLTPQIVLQGTAGTDIYTVTATAAIYSKPSTALRVWHEGAGGYSSEGYWTYTSNRRLAKVKVGDEVTLVKAYSGTFYQVANAAGTTGYVQLSKITFTRTDGAVPGEMIQARQIRDQLFRIYRVTKDTENLTVTAYARHIFYDQMSNVLVSCNIVDKTVQEALAAQSAACLQEHPFTYYSDDATTKITQDYSLKNAAEAQLDTEIGLLPKAKLKLLRDNFDVYMMKAAGIARTVPLRYGSNLKGVNVDVNDDSMCNRIVPVGKTKDGEPLLIDSPFYIDSPNNFLDTVIRARVIEYEVKVGEKDDAGVKYTTATAKTKLIALANADFAAGIDGAELTMTVNFLQLGDTVQYRQYRELDRMYLYDTIPIIDALHGVAVTAEVTEYEFDCLTGRYNSLKIGITGGAASVGSISGFEIASGSLSGTRLINGSIGASQIMNGAINSLKIGAATIEAAHIQEAAIASAHIQDAAIETAKIKDAAIETAKIKDAAIETAKIKDAAIDTAKIKDASVSNAKIDSAGISYAIIKDLVAGTAIFSTGIGDSLYLSRLVVTEANIAALTLGNLMMQDSDGDWYKISLDGDGNVQTTLVEVQSANVSASFTADISASVIVKSGTAPSTPYAGQLWLNTTDNIVRRCTAITPAVVWAPIQASELHTSYVNAVATGLEIGSSGKIDVLSGGTFSIKSLGAMSIEAGGDFNLNAGSGSEFLGISTNGVYRFFAGAAANDGTDAKYAVSPDGSLVANDANIRGEINANGSITFGDGITVSFANDAARITFLAALFAGAYLPYSQGGTNAASRAGALANLGLLAGIAEVSTITAQNIADRYLLMLPGVTVADNNITPSRAGYYCLKSSSQKKTNVHTVYQPMDGGDDIAPTDSYGNWYDTSTPTYGAVTANGSVYCYNKAGTATNTRTGTATVTVTYQTIWGYAYKKMATSTPYYRDYAREVYWAECPAPVVGNYNSAAVKTAVLTFTRSVTTSATYNLYYGTAADGFASKTLIGSVTTATASIVFSLLEQTTLFRAGTYYLFLERDGTYETSAITISAASLAFTYFTGAKRTEEYVYNGTDFALLASGAPYLQVPFIDGSNSDMTISVTSTYGSSAANNMMAGTGDGWISNAYTMDAVPTITLTLKVKLQQITLVLRNRNATNYVPELITVVGKDGSTVVTTKAALTSINLTGNAGAYATHIIRLENALPADVITIAFAKVSMNYTSMGKIRVYGYLGGGSGNTIVI